MRFVFLAFALLLACGPRVSGGKPGLAPDFSLTDVNPASARYTQQVSPQDYRGQVSAWYFGHST